MEYIIRHWEIILSFFTVPLFGWVLYKSFNDRVIWIALAVTIIFLLPCFIGYSYINNIIGPLLFYTALSCGYYFIIEKYKNIYATIIKPTIALFFILGLISFTGGFNGTISVESVWKVRGYKIEYLRDQGFSGGPLMKYELYKYADIPIFIKHVDSKIDTDTIKSCIVKFKYDNFSFDNCSFTDRVF